MEEQNKEKPKENPSQDGQEALEKAEKSIGKVENTLHDLSGRLRALEELLNRLQRQADDPDGEGNSSFWNTETGLA